MWLFKRTSDKLNDWHSGYFQDEKGTWLLSECKLNYTIEEARLFLQAVWDGKGRLVQKAGFLLAVIVGLIGFLFTEFILKYDHLTSVPFWQKLVLLLYFLILFVCFLILTVYQLPLRDNAFGTPPRNIFMKEVMNSDFEEIAVTQLEYYQDRINYNIQRNTRLAMVLLWCYLLVVVLPISTIIIWASCVFCHLWN
jgi:uncharacterized membrane protein YhaH (DUF805 family)